MPWGRCGGHKSPWRLAMQCLEPPAQTPQGLAEDERKPSQRSLEGLRLEAQCWRPARSCRNVTPRTPRGQLGRLLCQRLLCRGPRWRTSFGSYRIPPRAPYTWPSARSHPLFTPAASFMGRMPRSWSFLSSLGGGRLLEGVVVPEGVDLDLHGQPPCLSICADGSADVLHGHRLGAVLLVGGYVFHDRRIVAVRAVGLRELAVSYTHLTLPTILRV